MDLMFLIQVGIAVALIALILMQNQGTGLGKSFGGAGVSYHSRKGLERYMFAGTIGLAILFAGLALIGIIL